MIDSGTMTTLMPFLIGAIVIALGISIANKVLKCFVWIVGIMLVLVTIKHLVGA